MMVPVLHFYLHNEENRGKKRNFCTYDAYYDLST